MLFYFLDSADGENKTTPRRTDARTQTKSWIEYCTKFKSKILFLYLQKHAVLFCIFVCYTYLATFWSNVFDWLLQTRVVKVIFINVKFCFQNVIFLFCVCYFVLFSVFSFSFLYLKQCCFLLLNSSFKRHFEVSSRRRRFWIQCFFFFNYLTLK